MRTLLAAGWNWLKSSAMWVFVIPFNFLLFDNGILLPFDSSYCVIRFLFTDCVAASSKATHEYRYHSRWMQACSTPSNSNTNDVTRWRSNHFSLVFCFMIITLALRLEAYYCRWHYMTMRIAVLMRCAHSSRSINLSNTPKLIIGRKCPQGRIDEDVTCWGLSVSA